MGLELTIPETKSHMLHQPSQPGTLVVFLSASFHCSHFFYSSNLYLIFLSPLLNSPHSLRPATNKLHVEPTFRFLGKVERRKCNRYAGKAD